MNARNLIPKERVWYLATLPFKAYIALAPIAFFLTTIVAIIAGGLYTGIHNSAIAGDYARIMQRVEYGFVPCLAVVLIDTWWAARKQDRRRFWLGLAFLVVGLLSMGLFHLLANPPKTR